MNYATFCIVLNEFNFKIYIRVPFHQKMASYIKVEDISNYIDNI